MSALICYRNLIDLPDCSLSLSSGSELDGYPLTNLQTRQLARSARIPTLGSPMIVVDLGSPQLFDLVGLIGINVNGMRGSGDITVQYSGNGIVWTTATAVCPADAGAPDIPRSVLVRTRQPATTFKINTRYLRIQPNWSTTDGYREIGRLYIADGIDIPPGCDAGWELGGRDYGVLDRSSGLQYYADRRTRGRVLTMPMTGITTEIAYGFKDDATIGPAGPSFDDLFNWSGTTGDVIVAPRASSPLWIRRTGVYGHLTEDSLRLRHIAGPRYECTLNVEEER
jgi:hypothetical protein